MKNEGTTKWFSLLVALVVAVYMKHEAEVEGGRNGARQEKVAE